MKLVRDKIPEIIESEGGHPDVKVASGVEYQQFLREKLDEEVCEFLDSSEPEELADILEVIHALCDDLGVSFEEVENIRLDKKERKGGFGEGFVLK